LIAPGRLLVRVPLVARFIRGLSPGVTIARGVLLLHLIEDPFKRVPILAAIIGEGFLRRIFG
jgi:hypothetical protein